MKNTTLYVIALEKFDPDDQNLYYNVEKDTWAKDLKYATKFANRHYVKILAETIGITKYCHVEELNSYTVFTYYGEDIKDEAQFNHEETAITYAKAVGADEVVYDWTGEVIYKK